MDRPYVIDTATGPAVPDPAGRSIRHALARVVSAPLDIVEGLLSPDVTVSSLTVSPLDDAAVLRGPEAVCDVVRAWVHRVPDISVALAGLLTDGLDAVAELDVTGRGVQDVGPMTAPMLVWATFNGAGRVRTAAIAFDWSLRRYAIDHQTDAAARAAADQAQSGERPGERHSQGWYREFAERFAEAWSWDPDVAARATFASDCVFTRAGTADAVLGCNALLDSMPTISGARPTMVVDGVLGEGSTLAVRFTMRPGANPARPTRAELGPSTRGVFLAGLDADDRIHWLRRFGAVGPGGDVA